MITAWAEAGPRAAANYLLFDSPLTSQTTSDRAGDVLGLHRQSSSTPVTKEFLRGSILSLAAVGSLVVGSQWPAAAADTTGVTNRRLSVQHQGDHLLPRPSRPGGMGQRVDSPALVADELKEWLFVNDTELAQLCGFSRRSLVNWRNGSGSYGASLRRLYSIHALVGQLRAVLGASRATLWLEGSPKGKDGSRRGLLGDEAGISGVISEAEQFLFSSHPPHVFDVESGLLEREQAAVLASARTEANIGDLTPRRVRHVE